MYIQTATISVNGAFIRDIKEDNRQLRRLLANLDAISCRALFREQHYHLFSQLIVALRDQLAFHFSLEEAFGYFEDALNTAPHLTDEAQRLRKEHGELFEEISDLADSVEKFQASRLRFLPPRELAARYRAFALRFRQHEAGEQELILGAYGDDLGVGD